MFESMWISVAEAARRLEARGELERLRRDDSERIIARAQELLQRPLPQDLIDFYRERIGRIGDFVAITPVWNDHVGWNSSDEALFELIHADALPLLGDGRGSTFGLDITPGVATPAVYFFDHENEFAFLSFAAGSSLGAFLLLAADHDRALEE
ncbi:MAG: SMI1/KNR4 family protein, partial [Phenylobacterium sp.]|uniref:SMI1/KNR4 family protein n=1 Tax=Phenylobacterium sp. TaxID=1871053 RepID=UPI002A369BFC